MAKVQKEIRKSGKSLGKNLRRANKKSDLERKEKKPFSSKDGLDCVGITSVVSR